MTEQSQDGRLLFLSAEDVGAALPPVRERLQLAARAMRALTGDAELPPKIGVHPRQTASFAHAMPAFVRGSETDGTGDLLGLKWVSGFPGNVDRNKPAIMATVLLSDPLTGKISAVVDGGGLTAHRTAAVTGVAIELWLASRDGADSGDGSSNAFTAPRVAIIGAGAQARSHLPVLGHLLPGSHLLIADQHFERTEQVVREAMANGAFSLVEPVLDAAEAVDGADVVLTMIAFGAQRQIVPAPAFGSAQLIVAVDYDMCVPSAIAQRAAARGRFVVDERAQFAANRAGDVFARYPDPSSTLGELLTSSQGPRRRPALEGNAGAPALVTHLGVGVTDLVFADAVVRAARARGLGTRIGDGTR